MNRADPLIDVVVSQQSSATDTIGAVGQRYGETMEAPRPRRPSSPLRITLAPRLGNTIDGAWWPRTGLISRELPELTAVLAVRLGEIVDIDVNWSSLQRQPDVNWDWWQGIRPHIMTISGRDAQAKLLLVPHRTGAALAMMVLCRAAGLPVHEAHRDSRALVTADSIVRMAQGEKIVEVRRTRQSESAVKARGAQA
jgi:hypothetical protein